jgi:vacuolar protein sorting-associated protein 35
LLSRQLFATRRTIAHAVVGSVLKNETVIESAADVDGVLDLCHVLVKDQGDAGAPAPAPRGAPSFYLEREDLAEEQGWVARMVHLFRADALDVQYELLQAARRHFETGGERMRYTFPALITASVKLCRRHRQRAAADSDAGDGWRAQAEAILKFARKLIAILATQVEAPSLALRLFLLAAQVGDECGFEDLAYDLYVQAFSVYEDAISESRAQLQAITLITGALQAARGFGPDNYDTLITKAALHGAKLLKKPHQATAVHLASHMWWQDAPTPEDGPAKPASPPAPASGGKEDGEPEGEGKAFPHRDSKRVLECLQKALRIANSCIEEIVTVQLYCDTLDKYLYFLDRGAPAVSPARVRSMSSR